MLNVRLASLLVALIVGKEVVMLVDVVAEGKLFGWMFHGVISSSSGWDECVDGWHVDSCCRGKLELESTRYEL